MSESLPRETDMFPHIKAWLLGQGYDVYGEVKNCDIAATRSDTLVLVEIKRSITLTLIHQIVKRQQTNALVYGAVIAPPEYTDRKWRDSMRLFKRLGAGLLVVYMEEPPRVEALFHPSDLDKPQHKAMTKAFKKELQGRLFDVNIGGSPGFNAMNSHKEKALRIAVAIDRLGPSTKAVLAHTGASALTGSILRTNRHGWFVQYASGLFDLTEKGRAALVTYRDLADHIRLQVNRIVMNSEKLPE
jgi:Uncharacterized conserved protein